MAGRAGGGGFSAGGGGFNGGARNLGGGVGSSPSFNRPQIPQNNLGANRNLGGGQGLGGAQGLGSQGLGGQRNGLGGQGLGGAGLGANGAGQGLNRLPEGRSPLQNGRPGLQDRPGLSDRATGLDGNRGLGANGAGLNGGAGNRDFNALRASTLEASGRLPGLGSSFGLGGEAPGNRAQTLEQRQTNLSDRLSTGREDWQSHRQDMQGNHQDWRGDNREDWQNWADNTIANHGDWYHDCWHDNWYPGSGWNYMWDNYPAAAAFGVTAWGVNRIGYSWGYWGYYNPYYTPSATYNYSQPIVIYQSSGEPSASGAPAEPAVPSSDQKIAERELAKARDEFYKNNFEEALKSADRAVRHAEHDAAVHEFRGLVLFALRRYAESAAAVYGVLSAGPGWDWTTMSTLYSSTEVYNGQLRGLEQYSKTNADSADAHFLLGYHYLVAGHTDAARNEFQLAQKSNPDDRLLKQLVMMTTPPNPATSDAPAAAPTTPPATDVAVTAQPADAGSTDASPTKKTVPREVLYGHWKATQQSASFDLTIKEDGTFVWLFERDNHRQSVRGVFAVDQNQLALEPDAGGTMLADITMFGTDEMQFKMISGDSADTGMRFRKVK